jgi:hypothetical protein
MKISKLGKILIVAVCLLFVAVVILSYYVAIQANTIRIYEGLPQLLQGAP